MLRNEHEIERVLPIRLACRQTVFERYEPLLFGPDGEFYAVGRAACQPCWAPGSLVTALWSSQSTYSPSTTTTSIFETRCRRAFRGW